MIVVVHRGAESEHRRGAEVFQGNPHLEKVTVCQDVKRFNVDLDVDEDNAVGITSTY